jgi:hypothetical protein
LAFSYARPFLLDPGVKASLPFRRDARQRSDISFPAQVALRKEFVARLLLSIFDDRSQIEHDCLGLIDVEALEDRIL